MPPRPPKANPRRTTLGPVSMNNSTHTTPSKIPKPRKARQSMMPRVGAGGGQQSLIPPPSPSNSVSSSYSRRASIGGGGGGRKSMGGSSTMSMSSSTGRMHTSSNVKQDPRPIQDKTYQQHCIRTLLTYLTKSSYDYPVNLKSLAQPSGKDFQHIVTFLLKQVDPTFGTNDQKMEEEVALHFKALGYPYPVSKTALVAAGSPHTWPSLLAALAWLVEHIVVITACQEEDDNNNDHPNSNEHHQNSNSFESLGELEQKTDKAFFQYLHKAYAAFLEGSIERSDQLTEGLLDMFEEDNNIIEREIERVTDLNATMVEKINLLRQQSERYVTTRVLYCTVYCYVMLLCCCCCCVVELLLLCCEY
jgi:kinetochore protein NDC80